MVLDDSSRQCEESRGHLGRVRVEWRRLEDELANVRAQMTKAQLSFKQLSAKQEAMGADARSVPPAPEAHNMTAVLHFQELG